ncbi:MAG: dTMP kinase [Longimicrobiales bacterium]|nr:dTMP kinase [Longimicrobiales bacterium]
MSAPRFVVLEGVEGSGKSTQVRLLAAWLAGRGVAHTCTREPGGTEVGEAIRRILLAEDGLDVPPETELLLVLAARAAFLRSVVRPALERGEVVVADRFDLSTFAYQGYGRGLDLEQVRLLNDFATRGLRPDLYVVLDLPSGEGARRQAREGKTLDRIERAGEGFLERVREGYRELATREGRVRVVNARGTPEEVHARIRDLLASSFPETFAASGV